MSNHNHKDVIYQGVKCYWGTRNAIDVTIVEHHAKFNVVEVIAYEPVFDYEAPRIYLDTTILCSKINHDEIHAKLSVANGCTETLAALVNKSKALYILSRLIISEVNQATKTLKIAIQFNVHDMEECGDTDMTILVQKPSQLVEFETIHNQMYENFMIVVWNV